MTYMSKRIFRMVRELFCYVAILACLPCVQSRQVMTDTKRLYQYLMDDYLPVRPGEWHQPVNVTVELQIYQILGLDGKHQVLSTVGQLMLLWNDASFAWNRTDFGGIVYISLSAEDIWTPIVGIRNSVGEVIGSNAKANYPLRALYDGMMAWVPAGPMHTSCDLNMFSFPYDIQECAITISSISDPEQALVLQNNMGRIFLNFYMESKEFDLIDNWVEVKSIPLPEYEIDISSVSFWVRLQRKHAYYMLNILVPTFVLAILTAFTFLVPIDAGEKLSLSITILLSFFVFMLILSDMTPQTSDNMPILAIYLTTTVCISAGAMLCTIIVQNIYHKSPVTPLPGFLRTVAFGCLAQVLLRRTDQVLLQPKSDVDQKAGQISGDRKQKATVEEGISNVSDVTECIRASFRDDHTGGVQKITNKLRDSEEEEKLRDDWRLAATVIDRFFFIMFLTVQVLMCLVPTVIVPAVYN